MRRIAEGGSGMNFSTFPSPSPFFLFSSLYRDHLTTSSSNTTAHRRLNVYHIRHNDTKKRYKEDLVLKHLAPRYDFYQTKQNERRP